jgi:hypothetical protein
MSILTITQNKVAGFEPRWASFPGFSILFDNPGDSTEQAGSLLRVDCSTTTSGPLELYRKLDESLGELDRDHLIRTFLFCPLPPSSYHLTVWDGVNVDNIGSVRPGIQADWSTFLNGLPDSLRTPPDSIAAVTASDLMQENGFGAMSFRFDTLDLWKNQALVARLRPSDRAHESYQQLCRARARLCDTANRQLGISPAQSYSPHVTLGYFANREGGQRANAQVEAWTELFRSKLAKTEVTYPSMALYGFTDMISFFKLERAHHAACANPG